MMVAGLIDAMHFAAWADAPAVLDALSDAELAEGIAESALPLSVAVSDFVLADPEKSAALLALARRALMDQTVADPDSVLRALIRLTDPAVDEFLFRDDSALRPRQWVLRAIVRDRRGADGRPVIVPGVERFLRQQVHRIERRLAGYDNPHPARIEQLLLGAALEADDPDLAAFALPLGIRLRLLSSVARGLQTLRDHGRLDDLWSGGLREALAEALADAPNYRYSLWQELVEFGDADPAAQPTLALRFFYPDDHLPLPEDADQWTAPGTASQNYTLRWESVLAYAAVAGSGEEETQAGQSTSRGLDEAAAREDVPDDARAELEMSYPRSVYWTARPDIAALICASVDERGLNPATRHFGMRELLRRGLLHGSLSAADAVDYAAPASDVLALAIPTPAGLTEYYTAKGDNSFAPHNVTVPPEAEERYQADLRAAIAETVGPDPARWLKVLTRVAAWEDSLAELVRAVDEGEGLPTRRGHRWPRGVDPAAVLLEVAPEGVVEDLLAAATQAADSAASSHGASAEAACAAEPTTPTAAASAADRTTAKAAEAAEAAATADAASAAKPSALRAAASAADRMIAASAEATDAAEPGAATSGVAAETRALVGTLTRILDRGPVPRRLLDHALGPHGTPAMRLAAARNPAATGGTLWRLADREPAEPGVLAAVYLHPLASRELRVAAVVRSESAGGLYPGLVRRLVTRYADHGLLLPALESRSPEVLHTVLRRGGRVIETDRRIAAYARLAEVAGPEPVWALELERVGSLERMHEAVRASMAAHSDAPLRDAAAGIASPSPERVTEAWDAAFHPSRPDTADRVRVLLDGRPDRWLRLLKPDTTLFGLLAELDLESESGLEPGTGPAASPRP